MKTNRKIGLLLAGVMLTGVMPYNVLAASSSNVISTSSSAQTGLIIEANKTVVNRGGEVRLSAKQHGLDTTSTTVFEIEGPKSFGTYIDGNILKISKNENLNSLRITARSGFTISSNDLTINVTDEYVSGLNNLRDIKLSSVKRLGNSIVGVSNVANVTVTLYSVGSSSPINSAKADRYGEFSIPITSQRYNDYYVVANYFGYNDSQRVYVENGSYSENIRFLQEPRFSLDRIEGKVSIPGANIEYRDDRGDLISTATADRNGYFTIFTNRRSPRRGFYIQVNDRYAGSKRYELNDYYNNRYGNLNVSNLRLDGYRVTGRVNDYYVNNIYVYRNGRQIGSGRVERDGYFSIDLYERVYNDYELEFRSDGSNNNSGGEVVANNLQIDRDNVLTGYLRAYPNAEFDIYYNGSFFRTERTNYEGYFSVPLNGYYNSQDFRFYLRGDRNSQNNRTKVYPRDARINNYGDGVDGVISDYKDAKVYVYYRDSYIGYGTTDRDGKFSIRFNNNTRLNYQDIRDLTFYVDRQRAQTRVYPKDLSLDNRYRDRVNGTLSEYKETKLFVYSSRNEYLGEGTTDRDGKFSIRLKNAVNYTNDLIFYVEKASTEKEVTPKNVSVTSSEIKGNYDKNVYIKAYYNSALVGGAWTSSSNGDFTITIPSNMRVYNDRNLRFYVENKTAEPKITIGEKEGLKIEGTASSGATITIKDSDNKELGSGTVNKDGKFSITLNRALKLGEKLTITATEKDKADSSITYTVIDKKVGDLKRIAYINGFPDGTFKPNANMTRAEAATMFAKLLNNSSVFTTSNTTKFKDANNQWYSQVINYIVDKGLISGYPDGTFRPDESITRAEFAKMISGYITVKGSVNSNFKDVEDHWAKDAIEKLYGNKNISGYPDGTFKPNANITRAEAVTILNSVFGRNTTKDSISNPDILRNLKSFRDVGFSEWFYANVMDASNQHESYKDSNDNEVWTKVN